MTLNSLLTTACLGQRMDHAVRLVALDVFLIASSEFRGVQELRLRCCCQVLLGLSQLYLVLPSFGFNRVLFMSGVHRFSFEAEHGSSVFPLERI